MEHLTNRIVATYGEVQNANGQNSQHWFWADEASCSILGGHPDPNWWWLQRFNGIAKAANKYHGDGIIACFGDGHAAKVQRKKMIMDVATEGELWSTCRPRNWGLDGNRGTTDDLDNDVTRFWGRSWDPSY
jgi:prepilin-type processing-associated H-X9-DG protein